MNSVFDRKGKLISSIIVILFEVLLGVLLIVIPAEDIIDVCLKIIGLLLIVLNVIPSISYYQSMKFDRRYQIDFITSIISVILGVLLLIVPGVVLSIILACWFVIMPIVRICIHPNHKEQFKREIPYLIVGLILSLFSFSFIADLIVKIIGVLILVGALSHLIFSIKIYRKKDIDDNIIDAEVKDL